MLEKDALIKVKNTTNSRVGYLIPDLGNLHRSFMPGETKEVPFEEIQKLSFVPGGEVLLRDHLTIQDEVALRSVLGDVEPEYFYTESDVETLLTTGSVEAFMDFLDFAPEGLINLAKDLAVAKEIPDIRKRDAILRKTGFNVTKAIEINHETGVDDGNTSEQKVRRVAPPAGTTSEETTGRRTAPKYKVTVTQ